MREIPKSFTEAAGSLYGLNGGNPESPVWLCGLEWGGGYKLEKPEEPDFYQDNDVLPVEPETVKAWLKGDFDEDGTGRPGGSAFYRVQVALLKAIVDGDLGKGDPYTWMDEYKFFSKGCYGLGLNAFPVSMRNRATAWKNWTNDKVLKVDGRILSFAEWTGIPDFGAYRDWCAGLRQKAFCSLRRQYHPAVIYCGGKDDADYFFRMWADEADKNAESGTFAFQGSTTEMEFRYRWLDNSANEQTTLLVVGPFFGGPYGLNSYDDILDCGQTIRRMCDAHFNDGGAWLQRDKFIPLSAG